MGDGWLRQFADPTLLLAHTHTADKGQQHAEFQMARSDYTNHHSLVAQFAFFCF